MLNGWMGLGAVRRLALVVVLMVVVWEEDRHAVMCRAASRAIAVAVDFASTCSLLCWLGMYMREELTVCNRKERSPWPVDGVKKELGWDQKVTYRIAGQPPGETLYILSCPVEADLETAEASTLFEAGTT
ncbi:hypothetical protein B0H16DRAFT_1486961 [Mycena metata]|uniref:Uncharacterized protein n=1 Tax=Mycena metata TaxID=1033252 RepID=A0AAD7DFG0_9AGAR|nr:hypothetical protein B0H16DRAFT_1486961 [Mycena metata]